MIARILEFVPLMEKKDEFIRVVKKEVLPILKKQEGFLEFLPLVPEIKTEKVLAVTLWTDKKELERDEKEWSPRVEQILKPYLSNPSARKLYMLETTLCEQFEKTLIA
jgi:quinol monooxygenase YgiN